MRKVLIGVYVIGIMVVSVLVYFVVADYLSPKETKGDSEVLESMRVVEQVKEVSKDKVEEYEKKNLNPFGEEVKGSDLTDHDLRNYIHGMSHQKVIAEEKWGFYGINTARIEWLLHAVNEVSHLENKDLYIDILTKWLNDDFATVDKDHNAIWDLQGGTIGRATGIMTIEEERAYVESKEDRR